MASSTVDVAVIGAGAAGLAAAAHLARHECSVCVLEARDRIGGRILTRHEPSVPVPLELGAEFVHGQPATTSRWLEQRGTPLIDAPDERWILQRGKLRKGDDLFPELKARLAKAPRPRHDVAFREFLDGPARRHVPPRIREFALMLVEGYDAADSSRVSALGTLEEWCGDSGADAATFRPQGGYASLLDALAGALDPKHVHVQLCTVVREIRWQRGEVTLAATQHARGREIAARAALVTLFFAGEAAETGGESGTVAGALESGTRAAEQVLAALAK